jgi:hypothetical protein
MADTQHTPGPWTIDHERIGPPGEPVALLCDSHAPESGTVVEWPRFGEVVDDTENEANARLLASCPDLLNAIEVAGRIVAQVLDSPNMTSRERSVALSGAWGALGPIYFTVTGTPLAWSQCEQSIAKAKGGA